MGPKLLLWAMMLGFAGAFAGMQVGASRWPDSHTAPGWGLVLGSLAGALAGVGIVWVTHPRRLGD